MRLQTVRNFFPALATLALTIAALIQPALALPQHGDEAQYVWSAAYFGGRLARLDFANGAEADSEWRNSDPGWDPRTRWALSQPMGSRIVYAAALGATGSPAPALPFNWDDSAQQGPDQLATSTTLLVSRATAVLCAALGLALFAARLGWRGGAAAGLLLAIPHARDDLARAWAEGPLVLGFGLCAVAYGSRWLAGACGLAATFKLTALGLWPLAIWPGVSGRLRPMMSLLTALFVWCALTPPSWFGDGPLQLLRMIYYRRMENAAQTEAFGTLYGLPGLLDTRYLLPLELAAAISLALLAPRLSLVIGFWRHPHRSWRPGWWPGRRTHPDLDPPAMGRQRRLNPAQR